MEMKAPTTTAQPQPPSGGVYPWGPPSAGGMSAHEEEDDEDGDEISCSCSRTTGCRGEENPAAGALGSGVKTCGRNRAESWLNQYRSEGQTHKSSFHTSQHFYLICCQLRDELWRKGGMRNERSSTVVKSKHAEKKKKFVIFMKSFRPSAVMVRKSICAGPGPHANIPEVDKHLSYLSYRLIIKD